MDIRHPNHDLLYEFHTKESTDNGKMNVCFIFRAVTNRNAHY
jgi:hypothetical protein